jgi:hypothetical protein
MSELPTNPNENFDPTITLTAALREQQRRQKLLYVDPLSQMFANLKTTRNSIEFLQILEPIPVSESSPERQVGTIPESVSLQPIDTVQNSPVIVSEAAEKIPSDNVEITEPLLMVKELKRLEDEQLSSSGEKEEVLLLRIQEIKLKIYETGMDDLLSENDFYYTHQRAFGNAISFVYCRENTGDSSGLEKFVKNPIKSGKKSNRDLANGFFKESKEENEYALKVNAKSLTQLKGLLQEAHEYIIYPEDSQSVKTEKGKKIEIKESNIRSLEFEKAKLEKDLLGCIKALEIIDSI